MKTAHMFYFIFTGKNNLKDIYYCNIDAISYSKSKKNLIAQKEVYFQETKNSCNLTVIFLMTLYHKTTPWMHLIFANVY